MKRIMVAVVMMLIAGGVCGLEIFTISNNVNEYNRNLEEINRLFGAENFEKAGEISSETLENWKSTAKCMDQYLYHDYIDDITKSMSSLPVYADNMDTISAKAEIENIKIQLTSLKESELPYIHNIL